MMNTIKQMTSLDFIYINHEDPVIKSFLQHNRLAYAKPYRSIQKKWASLTEADIELFDSNNQATTELENAASVRVNTGLVAGGQQVWASGYRRRRARSMFTCESLFIKNERVCKNRLVEKYHTLFGVQGALVCCQNIRSLSEAFSRQLGYPRGTLNARNLEVIYRNMRDDEYQLITEDFRLTDSVDDAKWFRMPTKLTDNKGREIWMTVGRNKRPDQQPFHAYEAYFSSLAIPYCCVKPKEFLELWAAFDSEAFQQMISCIKHMAVAQDVWDCKKDDEDLLSLYIRYTFHCHFMGDTLLTDGSYAVFNTGLKTNAGDELCILFTKEAEDARWHYADIVERHHHTRWGAEIDTLLQQAEPFRPNPSACKEPDAYRCLLDIQQTEAAIDVMACVVSQLMLYPMDYLQRIFSFFLDESEEKDLANAILHQNEIDRDAWNTLRRILSSDIGDRARRRMAYDVREGITKTLRAHLVDKTVIKPFYCVTSRNVTYLVPVCLGDCHILFMAEIQPDGLLHYRLPMPSWQKAYLGYRLACPDAHWVPCQDREVA